MSSSVRRILSSCLVLSVVIGGVIFPVPAQAQYGQQQLAEGSHYWGQDGWCYVIQGGRPERSNHFRVIADPSNPSVYDLYGHGRFPSRSIETGCTDRRSTGHAEHWRVPDRNTHADRPTT